MSGTPPPVPSLPSSPLPKRQKTMEPALDNVTTTYTDTIVAPTVPALPATTPIASSTAAPPLLIKKLSPNAQTPTRGSAFAAGYDIYSSAQTTIPARSRALVSTSLAISVPTGTYGRIAPRSGLAVKHSINTGAGVIDEDYRGEVKVLLFNHGDVDFEVKEGDRIAQLVLERIVTPEVVVVETLEESGRGAGGFGSTGGFGVGV